MGPRSQPGWQPTVEPTEGGATVEEWLTASLLYLSKFFKYLYFTGVVLF